LKKFEKTINEAELLLNTKLISVADLDYLSLIFIDIYLFDSGTTIIQNPKIKNSE